MSKNDEKTLAPVERAPLATLSFVPGVDPAYARLLGRSVQAGIAAGATMRMKGPKASLDNGKTLASVASFPATVIGEYLGTPDNDAEANFLAPFQIGLSTTSPSGQRGSLKLGV